MNSGQDAARHRRSPRSTGRTSPAPPQNFTDYLSQAAPADWTYKASDTWPSQGGEAAQGTSGVVGAVKAGQGTIGYADASQAGTSASPRSRSATPTSAPSADGAAAVADGSTAGAATAASTPSRTSSTARRPTRAHYPVTLASYFIACAKYHDATKGALVKGYLTYVVSADGQAGRGEGRRVRAAQRPAAQHDHAGCERDLA